MFFCDTTNSSVEVVRSVSVTDSGTLISTLRRGTNGIYYSQGQGIEYWECNRMFELVQIYEEAKYNLHELLRLHRIIKRLEMEEHDIHNIFELAKYNQLQYLQGKVHCLENEIRMLEDQKTKATKHILKLNKTVDWFEGKI